MKKWKVFVMGHDAIYPQMYINDPDFDKEKFVFVNLGTKQSLKNSDGFSCINQNELYNYLSLGKWWAESEGIYNIWRSGIYKDLEYIGFIHYDVELKAAVSLVGNGNEYKICNTISRFCNSNDRGHISFSSIDCKWDYNQKILADWFRPNKFQGGRLSRNCYSLIISDYNKFFGTKYTIKDLLNRDKINLCSLFLIDVKGYEKMMSFLNWVIMSHKLERFDTKHEHRLQGGLAERYFGYFMLHEYDSMLELDLNHCGVTTLNKENILS